MPCEAITTTTARAGLSPQGGLAPLPPHLLGCMSLRGGTQPLAPVLSWCQAHLGPPGCWGAGGCKAAEVSPPHSHRSPALLSQAPPSGWRPDSPARPLHRVVRVPVPPHPAVCEAPAWQPPALLLDVRGQPGADGGGPGRGHSIPGGTCRSGPLQGTLRSLGGGTT